MNFENVIEFCRRNDIEFHMYAHMKYITFKFYKPSLLKTFVHRVEWDEYVRLNTTNIDLSAWLIELAHRAFKIK